MNSFAARCVSEKYFRQQLISF